MEGCTLAAVVDSQHLAGTRSLEMETDILVHLEGYIRRERWDCCGWILQKWCGQDGEALTNSVAVLKKYVEDLVELGEGLVNPGVEG